MNNLEKDENLDFLKCVDETIPSHSGNRRGSLLHTQNFHCPVLEKIEDVRSSEEDREELQNSDYNPMQSPETKNSLKESDFNIA